MLKNKTTLATLILMITMLFGGVMTAHAEQQAGYFDEFEGNTIVGWGWDSSAPNTAVPVHVTVINKDTRELIGDYTPTAAIYRDDLKESGIGNGRHGFRITMNWESLPDGTYLIEGWSGSRVFGNSKTYVKGEVKAAEDTSAQTAVTAAGSMRSLGVFRTTGYCPCQQCSEGWGRRTSTGAIAQSNHTIAVDPRVIPYGTKVMINGVVYTAEDRGGGVKGNHIDIFFDSHSQTRQHGSRSQEVFILN